MIYLKLIALIFGSMIMGTTAAAGVCAFIVMSGVFTRLASRTRTSAYTDLYENMIILGGSLGNAAYIYMPHIPLYTVGAVLFGLFSGIFIGCLAMALAEVLNVFPVLAKRISLTKGLPAVVLCMAMGKAVGSFIQFYVL